MSVTFHLKPAHFETKNQICPNSLIFHRKMSDSAKIFILALNGIWSNSRTWIPVQSDLEKRLNWGKKKTSRIIQECVKFGYLKVRQNRDKKGWFKQNEFEFDIEGKYNEESSHSENEPYDQNGSRTIFQNEENFSEEKCPDNMFSTEHPFRFAENDPLPCSFRTEPIKEQTNAEAQDLFVCSLNENQKKIAEALRKYQIPDNEIQRMFGLPYEQIQNALLAYEQYRNGREIDNPIGCIKRAILSCWKPNKEKADKEFEREKIEQETNLKVEENQDFALKIIEKFKDDFHFNFNITVSGLAVNLKSKSGFYPLSMLDNDFKNILNWFIKNNLNS